MFLQTTQINKAHNQRTASTKNHHRRGVSLPRIKMHPQCFYISIRSLNSSTDIVLNKITNDKCSHHVPKQALKFEAVPQRLQRYVVIVHHPRKINFFTFLMLLSETDSVLFSRNISTKI